MDAGYRITVCRENIRDYDIPSLEQVLRHSLGVTTREFRAAFLCSDPLSFETAIAADDLQGCVSRLEDFGFTVTTEKLPENRLRNSCSADSDMLVYSSGFATLTDEDCRVLLYSAPRGVRRLARYKNLVTFGCCFVVISCYLLMIYSSF